MVRIVCYERTETGSSPVTSTKGDEQSLLTRDDKMADYFWISRRVKICGIIERFVRLRNFVVAGGALRQGSHDPYGKGHLTFMSGVT